MIELKGVRAVYGKTIALDKVNLSITPGIVGLYGPNGSGKSTLLRVVAGLHRPVLGQIVFDGAQPRPNDENLRRRMSYAGHDAGLYGRLSVEENLRLFATLWGAPTERVQPLLEQIGLQDRARSRVDELSAGLKRRASVARALVVEPEILLLDEPFASLDDAAADLVTASIKAWHAPGRTAIIATHGAKRLKSFATTAIVLRRGSVASDRDRQVTEVIA
ncbi:MAG: type transport system ATP-binding protein [Actinomycetota bacterium]|jgi:heme ABC exporter ATP-binding subunit CcmA|nr:type transport system ATP-binding protein [Actinomycetota bacterium]